MIGKVVGRRLGWPDDRIRSLSDEERAMTGAVELTEPSAGPPDCAFHRRLAEHARGIGAWGEIGAMRRALGFRAAAPSALPLR